MNLPNDKQVFAHLIELLAEAASDARQLAFLRGQNEWLAVDTLILRVRTNVIALAEGKEKQGFIQ